MELNTQQQMVDELRDQTQCLRRVQRTQSIAVTWLCILTVLTMISLVFGARIDEMFKRQEAPRDSWREARTLVDQGEIARGTAMIDRLLVKSPRNFYGYRLMGFVEQGRGNLQAAEINFAKTYELFPTEENEKNLAAIRKVRALESATDAGAHP